MKKAGIVMGGFGLLIVFLFGVLHLGQEKEKKFEKRDAAQITAAGHQSALKVVENTRSLRGKYSTAQKKVSEQACPFSNEDAMARAMELGLKAPRTTSQQLLVYEGYNDLFMTYGSCLTLDWWILNTIAHRESGFNSAAVNMMGFTGLFQTKKKHCEDVLKRYGLDARCVDLTDPHTQIMAATARLIRAQESFETICGHVNMADDGRYAMYLAHYNGIPALRSVFTEIQKKYGTCSHKHACRPLYEFWQKQGGGKRRSNKTPEEVCGPEAPAQTGMVGHTTNPDGTVTIELQLGQDSVREYLPPGSDWKPPKDFNPAILELMNPKPSPVELDCFSKWCLSQFEWEYGTCGEKRSQHKMALCNSALRLSCGYCNGKLPPPKTGVGVFNNMTR